jgi:Fe2+ or Zn2+ uptake regulation protein
VPEQTTRRQYLLAAITAHGRPVTTQLAEQLLTGTWPTYGRNTARKDLRGLARAGLLLATAASDGRTTYHLTTQHTGDR